MSVLLLGASGFLGSWTARALAAAGEETVALVRPDSDVWRIAPIPEVAVVRAPAERWAEVIAERSPDTLLSLEWAGVAGADKNDQAQWRNLERMSLLIDAAAEAGVARFVGVGSQAEYGPRSDTIDETASPAPVTEYGKAKVAASVMLRERSEAVGMDWVWARVFSTFGPLDHPYWVLPQLASAVMRGDRVPLTDGRQLWSYLCGPDAGSAFATIALSDDAAGIYNIGHPDAPPLRATVEQFAAELAATMQGASADAKLDFGAIPHGPTSVMKLEPDVSRLRSLGWEPRIALRDGLVMTARWIAGQVVPDPSLTGRDLPSDPHLGGLGAA